MYFSKGQEHGLDGVQDKKWEEIVLNCLHFVSYSLTSFWRGVADRFPRVHLTARKKV